MNSALSTKFLLWALLLFCCPDPGWTTQAEEMASLEVKMTNIMDRMTRLEAKMDAKDERITVLEDADVTKDKRIAILEAAIETLEGSIQTKDEKIAVLEVAMETLEKAVITKDVFTDAIETRDTQMCELEEEMKSLTRRITVTEETDVLLRGMVDQVTNPPYAFQCAWQGYWSVGNSVITYEHLTIDEISGGSNYNVTGGLDITTGVFTVGPGLSGVWAVTYSMRSKQNSGDINQAWLYINGVQIDESEHRTYYSDSEGTVSSLGSRSLYMRLEAGDTISLKTDDIYTLYQITLCFELAHFDWVPPM